MNNADRPSQATFFAALAILMIKDFNRKSRKGREENLNLLVLHPSCPQPAG
jgi:hypothetical protein